MKILEATVITQHEHSTDIKVKCNYHNYDYTVLTEVREGNSLPTTTLEGFTAPPSDEFIIELHEALDMYSDLTANEMERICGDDE